jgi:hypothetical protein
VTCEFTVADPWPALPTDDQCRAIGHLRRHAGPRVTLDATPVPEVATARCGNSWAHGPGLVRVDGGWLLCLSCAVVMIRPPAWQSSARVRVEVLRDPAPEWRHLVAEAAESAL